MKNIKNIIGALIGLPLMLCAEAQARQPPPTFEEFDQQAKVVEFLPGDLDEVACWVAQDPKEFDKVSAAAREQKDEVLLHKLAVTGAKYNTWDKVQQVIQEIERFNRKPSFLPQAPLASVEVFKVYSKTPQRSIAFHKAMDGIKSCKDEYSKVFFLTVLAKNLDSSDKFWQQNLTAFSQAVKQFDDLGERESLVDDYLTTIAERGGDDQISVAIAKLKFGIGSESSKIAVARGLINGGRYAVATSRALEVESPERRAKLLLRLVPTGLENEQGVFDESTVAFSELKKSIDQVDDDSKKMDLLLTYFETAQRYAVKANAGSFRRRLKELVLGAKPDAFSRTLFARMGRAYVIFRGLDDSEVSDFAINLLNEWADSKTGAQRDVANLTIARVAAEANDVSISRDLIQKINSDVIRMNAINEASKQMAGRGDVTAALELAELCDSKDSKMRIVATVLEALVRNGHFEQAKSVVKYIGPDQARSYETLQSLVRNLLNSGMKADDPWLQQLRSRSPQFESLVKLGSWLAEIDSLKEKVAVQSAEQK